MALQNLKSCECLKEEMNKRIRHEYEEVLRAGQSCSK
jgi:hypothetical protein